MPIYCAASAKQLPLSQQANKGNILLFTPQSNDAVAISFRRALKDCLGSHMVRATELDSPGGRPPWHGVPKIARLTAFPDESFHSKCFQVAQDAISRAKLINDAASGKGCTFTLEICSGEAFSRASLTGGWKEVEGTGWKNGTIFLARDFSHAIEEAEWHLGQIPRGKADELAEKHGLEGKEMVLAQLRSWGFVLRNVSALKIMHPNAPRFPPAYASSAIFSKEEVQAVAALLILSHIPSIPSKCALPDISNHISKPKPLSKTLSPSHGLL
jgi:hypothetical protein